MDNCCSRDGLRFVGRGDNHFQDASSAAYAVSHSTRTPFSAHRHLILSKQFSFCCCKRNNQPKLRRRGFSFGLLIVQIPLTYLRPTSAMKFKKKEMLDKIKQQTNDSYKFSWVREMIYIRGEERFIPR